MLRPGRRVQQRLGYVGHLAVGRVQQQLADLFRDAASARFPGAIDVKAKAKQPVLQQLRLGGLAAAVRPFHGQEASPGNGRIPAQDLLQRRHRGRIGPAARSPQLRLVPVAIAHAHAVNAHRPGAFHVKAPVAHHHRSGVGGGQGPADQLFLAGGGILRPGSGHRVKEALQAEMPQNPFRGDLRLPCGNAQVATRPLQPHQQPPDTRVHPVFQQARNVIPLPVKIHRAAGFLLRHGHIGLEGEKQRRPDKPAQGFRVRRGAAHLLRRIPHTVPDAFLRLGQRPIQVKQYRPYRTHSSFSPSTPKRRRGPAWASAAAVCSVIISPGATRGMPGG